VGRRRVTILADVCLGLAALLWAVPVQFLLWEAPRRNDGGLLWGAVFAALPLWGLLWIALAVATSRGGLDWALRARASQHALLALACAALAVVTVLSIVGRWEPASQLPWATRPLSTWGALVLPLVAIGFAVLSIHPGLAAALPPAAVRAPFAAAMVIGLAAGAALGLEAVSSANARAARRVAAQLEDEAKYHQEHLARIEALDPEGGFVELLGFANRFGHDDVRAAAIAKARRHPRFDAALEEVLRGPWAGQGLVWIEGCEIADPGALAPAARDAILGLARDARREREGAAHLRGDELDGDTRRALAAAEKLSGHGVDFLPALRELRAAMDVPRERQPVRMHAADTLDRWLAEHAGAGP